MDVSVFKFKIANDEVTPTRICSNCTERLLNAYELVCQVEKSEDTLRTHVEREQKDMLISDSASYQQHTTAIECDEDETVENEDFEVLEEEFQFLSKDGEESFTYEINHVASDDESEKFKFQSESETQNMDCNNLEQENEIKEECDAAIIIKKR